MTHALGASAAGWRWIAFFALILAAWAALFLMQLDPQTARLTGVEYWRALCAVSASDARFSTLFAMWALMSAAMMTPTAAPALAVYDDLTFAGVGARGGFAALAAGYLAAWLAFSALAAALQAALARAALVDASGRLDAPWISALLLALAGLYQFSALKRACLTRCRSPFAFFMDDWRPGAFGAWRMGLRLGVDCVGCCWALMALAFVFGTSSLLWMGAATAMMSLEKLPQIGRPLTRPLGVALLAAALWTLAPAWAGAG